jgi:hypothetical protein
VTGITGHQPKFGLASSGTWEIAIISGRKAEIGSGGTEFATPLCRRQPRLN